MRLLRCLIMVLATLSMTIHVASARAAHGASAVASVQAGHDDAGTSHLGHVDVASYVDHNCPPGHHHQDCCGALCCSSACCQAAIADGTFARMARSMAPPIPLADFVPDGAMNARLVRPPITA